MPIRAPLPPCPRPNRWPLLLAAAGVLAALGRPAQAQSFSACVAALKPQAVAAGVPGPVFDQQTAGLQADMSVLDSMRKQPEFKTPIWDYLSALVDDERVRDGQARLAQWRGVLAGIERRTGVDAATVVAVWGVESNFGQSPGSKPLVPSLATLACYAGGRAAYFRGELFATLKIIARGDVAPGALTGSWAGAFGQTQFMPSTFLRTAVDGDGDGRRDVVGSVPDALASTASYLARSGWQRGGVWGFEVRLPARFNTGLAGRTRKRPLSAWAALGVTRADGSAMPRAGSAGLMLLAGANGPAFLVTRNFDALYAYNAAESYALAIAHLSDRIKGRGGFVTPWPTDDPGLSRAERRELQTRLTQRGYDVGAPDGAVGDKTREAIADVERRLGWPRTGRPGLKILVALRKGG